MPPVVSVAKGWDVINGRDVVHTKGSAWIKFHRPTGVRNLPRRRVAASTRYTSAYKRSSSIPWSRASNERFSRVTETSSNSTSEKKRTRVPVSHETNKLNALRVNCGG